MTQAITDLATLRDALRDFAAARDWRPFHTPKNLAMAMIVEAAELVEHFQWATPEESMKPAPEKLAAIRDEVADTLIYLVELADVLDIDLIAAARDKVVKNAVKYPALKRGV
ncbi:MAG TPA: nucleotide pyrophosphohydrolase [Rhodocyclaceae bacterium]